MSKKIDQLRKKIDRYDKIILNTLGKRFEVSKQIGRYKLKKNLSINAPRREKEILEKRMEETKLNKKFIKIFFNLIFKESKAIQKKLK